ncbi:MAG: LptF/LptG family permease [Deinococcales bacterium]
MLKRLDRYLLKDSVGIFLFGLLSFSSLIILSTTLPRMQWVLGVPVQGLIYWLILQYPLAIVQTLPLALLLAVLLVVGRLAQQRELLALQAGGIPIMRLILPFVLLSIFNAFFTFYLSESVLPTSNAEVADKWWRLVDGHSGIGHLRQQIIDIGDFQLYFENADVNNEDMYGIRLTEWRDKELNIILADQGRLEGTTLELYNYRFLRLNLAAPLKDLPAEEVLRGFIRGESSQNNPENALKITSEKTLKQLLASDGIGAFEDSYSISQSYQKAQDPNAPSEERRMAWIRFHRKINWPLSNFSILLLALPLSMIFGYNRGISFGLCFLVFLLWYVFSTVGQLMAQAGTLPIWLGLWSPNIFFMFLALLLILIYSLKR